jgi:hypothetical protein
MQELAVVAPALSIYGCEEITMPNVVVLCHLNGSASWVCRPITAFKVSPDQSRHWVCQPLSKSSVLGSPSPFYRADP